jgi:hypothetical protein
VRRLLVAGAVVLLAGCDELRSPGGRCWKKITHSDEGVIPTTRTEVICRYPRGDSSVTRITVITVNPTTR